MPQADIRDLRKALAEAESTAALSRSETSGHVRQVEVLARELQATRAAKSRAEDDLRQQVGHSAGALGTVT